MNEENKYWTQEYGLQQAYKGLKIAYFPPILMIQLKRFDYDHNQLKNMKIVDAMEYQQYFNFSKWSISGEKQQYQLYAVLVHEGPRAQSGHYYNFIKSNDSWYKFNDQIVQKVQKDNVFKYNFGGFHQSLQFDAKQMKIQKKLVQSKTTAYMLVYIKQELKQMLMHDEEEYPEWIKNKEIYKVQLQQIKKNKKKFYHNVKFLDWQKSIQSQNCSDIGFLDESIVLTKTTIIEMIPKEMKISEWLYSQKLIDALPVQKKKKPIKGSKVFAKNDEQRSSPGIYIYYASAQRQNLTGFSHKPHHTMDDLLKISSTDPVIFKAPIQVKKQEYLIVIKKFVVEKQNETINLKFFYQSVLPVSKELTYLKLLQILATKYETKLNQFIVQGQQSIKGMKRMNYYIDDWKYGTVDLTIYSGPIPFPIPNKNQLLVCVVQQISIQLTVQEELIYSFPKWYQNKKQTINLLISDEKNNFDIKELKEIHNNLTLSELRKLIFENLQQQKKIEYGSPQNIVLRARVKKTSKNFTEVSESQFLTVKDITKYQSRIQYSYSSLTVQSRISQYQLQFCYRNKGLNFSQTLQIIVHRNQQNDKLVQRIKNHPKILQLLRNEGFQENQSEIILLSKDRMVINDIVSNEGKVYAKGQLDAVLKKQKNAVMVVSGRNIIPMVNQPTIQIKDEDVEPMVNILLHHVSQSMERVGYPRYFKIDRRMELFQLKQKVLDLIKDQTYLWEGKLFDCNPFKTLIRLYAKDNKKIVQLTDFQSLEQLKRLRIQEKNNEQNVRKMSRQLKNSKVKESSAQQKKDSLLVANTNDLQNQQQKNQQGKNQQNKYQQEQKPMHNQEEDEDQQIAKESQQEEQPAQQQEVTKISGPETIYGVFPKVKILKIQIIHNELIKPNIALRLNVDY